MTTKQPGRKINIFNIGSIRARLMLSFIFVAILAVAAAAVITFILGKNDGRQHVVNQLDSVVTIKQAEIESWVNLLNVNMNLVVSGEENSGDVQTLNIASVDASEFQAAYTRILSRFGFISNNMKLFDELFIMDTEGVVRLSTNPSSQNQKHAFEDYFINGMKGPYVEQPSYSLSAGEMLVVVTAPIIANGQLVGVMGGRASLNSLNDIMLGRAGLGNTGETYLVGSNHRLLTEVRNANFSIPDTYISTQGSTASIDNHQNGSATYLNYSGDRVIGVYRWVPDLKIALLAEQQEGEALAATNLTLKIIGGALALIVLLAILAARFITRSITQPVAELAASATLIAQGNLDQKVKIGRDDEVGKLAKAFNSMSTQLRDQFHQQEERAVQLRSINEVGRHISAILQIDELLEYVVTALQANFKYRAVGIFLNDQAASRFMLKSAADGYEIGDDAGVSRVINSVIQTSQPMLVNDLQHDPVLKPVDNTSKTMAELAVGIKVGDKLIGILDIRSDQALVFNEFDLFTTQALADQLAIAIENIRLYEQAQELATTKERSRLARDLHDAVSQTLFSASIIADVLPKLWEKDQEEGRRRLEEIRQLTRGALAEMRTLLFELKPAALADAEFSYLLHQLAESITGRTRINVKVLVEGQCELPPDLKIALYRITQEALNNVAKHANATQASINVSCQGGAIELKISDNGKGFDITKVRAESLGLGIMRGRAKEIGAEISVQSDIGTGTIITIKVKETEETENDAK